MQAKGGAGKMTLAKKIIAFARSIIASLLLKIKIKISLTHPNLTSIQNQEENNR